MMRTNIRLILVLLLVLAASTWAADPRAPSPANQKREVRAADIAAGTVVVTGTLGRPMHQMMHLRGIWRVRDDGKDDNLGLYVTHVNGRALRAAVEFQDYFVTAVDRRDRPMRPAKGETWEMDGYESYYVRMEPEAYMDALGHRLSQDPTGGFRCTLQVIVVGRSTQRDLRRGPGTSQVRGAAQTPRS
jgi:hypothetical protein